MDSDVVLCPVCLVDQSDLQEDSIESVVLVVTRCNHQYCVKCFDDWHSMAQVCAVCRSELAETRRSQFCIKKTMSPDAPVYEPSRAIGTSDEPEIISSLQIFNMRVEETYAGRISFERIGGSGNLRNLSFSLFDIVVESNTTPPVVLERHINLPMGGMDALDPYYEWLFLNAAEVKYASSLCDANHDCSVHVARRIHRLNIQHASAKNRSCIYRRIPCWKQYRYCK